MTHPFGSGSAGNAPRISDVYAVVLYDPETGSIRHVHNVTVYEGGRSVSEEEAIETAVTRASQMGHRTESLKIKVSKDPRHGRSPHRIDPDTGDFVPLPPRERPAAGGR
jgi:hypothetical protein